MLMLRTAVHLCWIFAIYNAKTHRFKPVIVGFCGLLVVDVLDSQQSKKGQGCGATGRI
jgi:hypothetical protein